MRHVADLLRSGGILIYIAPDATVAEAVRKMTAHNVGSILVLQDSRKLVGIFTERDLLRRVVLPGLDAARTQLRDVMTTEVVVASADMPRREVLRLMEQYHCRHIPVADGDRLLGVISLRDVLRYENEEKDFEIEQLRGYILQGPISVRRE